MVRSEILALEKITQKLYDITNQTITAKKREESLEQIDNLLEEREMLFEKLKPPYTVDEQGKGQEILQLNQQIERKLDRMFIQLKKEIQQMNKQKRRDSSYRNPYESVQVMDGMFVDQKK